MYYYYQIIQCICSSEEVLYMIVLENNYLIYYLIYIYIYPIQYLNEPFLSYECSRNNTILSIATLSILMVFHFYERHFH